MLENLVSILNTGVNTINYLLIISYNIGKIIVELLFVLYKLLCSLFTGLSALLVIIYEDSSLFSSDFLENFNTMNGVIRDGLNNVVKISSGIYDNLIYLAVSFEKCLKCFIDFMIL